MDIMVKRLHILLLVIFGCLMSVSAADNPKPVSYQYWLDNNFDAKVTGDIVNDDRRVKIPEEYFNGLSNGVHTLFIRAKDENGNWGRIASNSFYIFPYTVKDDSTATALKAYRYAIDDGEVRNVSITPTTSLDETLKLNYPSPVTKPIVYGNCNYTINAEAGTVSMRRSVYYDFVMQYQNESGVWSDLEYAQSFTNQSVTKDVRTVNIGGSVEIPEKPIGGTFEVVKFDIATVDDYSLRASEGCEVTIKTASGSTHTSNVGAAQMVESYRAHYGVGTYYAIIYNSLKNMANPSNGLTLTLQSICKKPSISVTNDGTHIATITSETEGSSIYYTIDGSNPTTNSIKYEGEFTMPHNGWIKAIAAKDGYGISYIDSTRVTGIQTATPEALFDHPNLTLTCETPGATIYYSIGSTYYDDYKKYTEPVKLEDNSIVYFKATSPNLDESARGSYTPTTFVCKTPEFEYDGRYLKVKSSENSTIRYAFTTGEDESEPQYYNYLSSGDSINITSLQTVWVYAEHNKLATSETVKYNIPAVFEGNNYSAMVRTPGQLATALKWTETEKYKVTRLRVEGNINSADIAMIKEQENLLELDLGEATVEEATLPDDAFAGLKNLLYFISPANLTSAGARLFDGCDDLGGIDWRSTCTVPADILGGKEYANLILFVDTEEQAAKSICKNIVVNGNIENITLVDADERAGFFAPRSFYVNGTMSYTRSFTQPTLLTGECQGWEAICLPFYPSTYTHESQGECTPFYNWTEGEERKPFWLNGFDYSGFVSTWGLYDNAPRIISLPNNDEYADEFILGGKMTFSVSNTTVYATTLTAIESNGYRFVSNFTNKPADESRSVLNSYEEYNGYKMGSVFVPGLRGAKAFEPYFEYVNADGNYAKRRGPEIGVNDGTTGIQTIPMRLTDKDVYSENGILYINSSSERDANLYNIGGQLVRKLHLTQGVNEVNGISKGVYVINKIKIIIK